MPGYYYFDWTYVVLILPCIIFSLWASAKVKGTFNKYNTVRTQSGMTGAQAAETVLRAAGIYDVSIEHISGSLTDHFDPRSKVIRLSDSVYASPSVSAVGVAAHEAGHAVQHATGYGPLKLRNSIIPVTNIGSQLSWPLLLIGLIFNWSSLFFLGILFFSLAVLFQLITLPVEYDASGRAMKALAATGILDQNELAGAKKTLSAAAMTYVAALAVSVAQLLRLLVIFGGRNRD